MADNNKDELVERSALERSEWQWLADQLRAWPERRVHPERTMSIASLHSLAAGVIEESLSASQQLAVGEDVRLALEHARNTFYRYARLHREKGTEEGDQKACANASMGEEMSRALAALTSSPVYCGRTIEAAAKIAAQPYVPAEAVRLIGGPKPFETPGQYSRRYTAAAIRALSLALKGEGSRG